MKKAKTTRARRCAQWITTRAPSSIPRQNLVHLRHNLGNKRWHGTATVRIGRQYISLPAFCFCMQFEKLISTWLLALRSCKEWL